MYILSNISRYRSGSIEAVRRLMPLPDLCRVIYYDAEIAPVLQNFFSKQIGNIRTE
jgi:hypothetical protein